MHFLAKTACLNPCPVLEHRRIQTVVQSHYTHCCAVCCALTYPLTVKCADSGVCLSSFFSFFLPRNLRLTLILIRASLVWVDQPFIFVFALTTSCHHLCFTTVSSLLHPLISGMLNGAFSVPAVCSLTSAFASFFSTVPGLSKFVWHRIY